MGTVDRDTEHLRLLSIFHYVYAGVSAAYALIPIIHVCMGAAILGGSITGVFGHDGPPVFVGLLFILIGGAIIILGLAHAALNFFAARFIAAREHYVFCFVAAVINCVFVPLGTLLGIFTIVVLTRDGVKALFGRGAEVPPAPR